MGTMKLLGNRTLTQILTVVFGAGFFFACSKHPKNENIQTIAVTQIIEHKALDEEYKGLIQGLADAGYVDGSNIKIAFENAQGNIATATQIATKFQSMKPSVVVAISTPSAQAVVGALKNTQTPVVFSAVTDPIDAKLVSGLGQGRSETVTGISDAISASSQLTLIKKLIPHIKKLGVIYNPGEQNSVRSIAALKKEAAKEKIEIVESTASKTSDVVAAAQSLVGKVEAVYVPNDNTAVSAIHSVVQVGEKNKLPVFAGDAGSFEDGVVAVAAYDRFILGKKVAEYVIKILKGAYPGNLSVATDHPIKLRINLKAAESMGLVVSKETLQGFEIKE